jgi:hypothetical protein
MEGLKYSPAHITQHKKFVPSALAQIPLRKDLLLVEPLSLVSIGSASIIGG